MLSSNKQTGVVVLGGDYQSLGLVRSLGRHRVPVYILDSDLCIARYSKYITKFIRCPDLKNGSPLLEFLENLAREANLHGWLIYPNSDEEVRFLAVNKERLEKYYRVTTPPWEITQFLYNKKMTHELAQKCGISTPKTLYPDSIEALEQLDIDFPVIIKPTVKEPFFGRLKKKAIKVDNREDLFGKFKELRQIIPETQLLSVQELIPGGTRCLYSVGGLYRSGKMLARVVAKRTRQHPMDFGRATTSAETVNIPELEEMAKTIMMKIGYSGLSEVEFMFDSRNNRYVLLEVNPRVWGWHTLAIGAGVDLPYLSYLSELGDDVMQNEYVTGVKWIRLLTDVPTAFTGLFNRSVTLSEYYNSFKGKKEFAVFSISDPLPFIAELMLLPYLWKRRGF